MYKIAEGIGIYTLENEVRKMIGQGYKPVGSMTISNGGDRYFQPMYKESNE